MSFLTAGVSVRTILTCSAAHVFLHLAMTVFVAVGIRFGIFMAALARFGLARAATSGFALRFDFTGGTGFGFAMSGTACALGGLGIAMTSAAMRLFGLLHLFPAVFLLGFRGRRGLCAQYTAKSSESEHQDDLFHGLEQNLICTLQRSCKSWISVSPGVP